ncbi:MAG TPA: hypothetical protein VK537_08485 [Galbitalea sp.]|nr:hypothetical protein [Galbitalea sp.]
MPLFAMGVKVLTALVGLANDRNRHPPPLIISIVTAICTSRDCEVGDLLVRG